MSRRKKEIDRAMVQAKKNYQNHCALTGQLHTILIGSHIFGRGAYPQFAAWSDNIIPVNRLDDLLIERLRPMNRILYIYRKSKHSPFGSQVRLQIKRLIIGLRGYRDIHGTIR